MRRGRGGRALAGALIVLQVAWAAGRALDAILWRYRA
jgi:hypothetical protein